MFPRSNAKIIARTPIAESRKRLRNAIAAVFPLLILMGMPVRAAAPLAATDFSRIRFSDGCAEKQWTQTPDGALELMLGPRDSACEATLEFYFPIRVRRRAALSYELRGSKPGLSLLIGVQEGTQNAAVYSSPATVLTQWDSDGARLNHFKDEWSPRYVSAIHFIVQPAPDSRWGTVTIRQIHFVHAGRSLTAAPPPTESEPTAEPAAVPAPAPAAVQPAPVALAQPAPIATPAAHGPIVPHFHFKIFGYSLILFTGLGILFTGFRPRRRRILSPLYEINTRTWKTHRDANDVVQYGGFKRITSNDLKAIKQAGFNTIWLMGIWEVGPKVRHISKTYAADYQGSPYAIYDYALSTDLGTEDEFKELVQRAHDIRLSVVIDFVPNHMGLDSTWLNDHPEYFIHKVLDPSEVHLDDAALKQKHPGYFPYWTPSYPQGDRRVPKTIMVAYGKDPYFYPWIDTAQLDYAQPGLRQRMIDVLGRWAKMVDGVRCDMAMLTLREQVKVHRHPEMSWDTFNRLMPNEFWTEAIHTTKKVNPNFVFIAETYWSMEGFLQNLGFDYTYNKPLYEAICSAVNSGHAEGLMNFLRLLGSDFLKRSVHFLENHDEERAMNALGDDRQRAAATILCTLPGIALLHHGQLEGKRERMPVQRVVPLNQEPEHIALKAFYRGLLRATAMPVFQEGRLTPLYSNNPALVSYVRSDSHTKVLVVINASGKRQQSSVFLMPGLDLHSGTHYQLNDLFFPFKFNAQHRVQASYLYPGSSLINQGLYVELDPFDAHIFVVEPQGALHSTQKAFRTTRQTLEEWPLNRVARAFVGAAFNRSSDLAEDSQVHDLAANPAGRQQ